MPKGHPLLIFPWLVHVLYGGSARLDWGALAGWLMYRAFWRLNERLYSYLKSCKCSSAPTNFSWFPWTVIVKVVLIVRVAAVGDQWQYLTHSNKTLQSLTYKIVSLFPTPILLYTSRGSPKGIATMTWSLSITVDFQNHQRPYVWKDR